MCPEIRKLFFLRSHALALAKGGGRIAGWIDDTRWTHCVVSETQTPEAVTQGNGKSGGEELVAPGPIPAVPGFLKTVRSYIVDPSAAVDGKNMYMWCMVESNHEKTESHEWQPTGPQKRKTTNAPEDHGGCNWV